MMERRLPAAAPRHRRRQLHRPRVRPDVPALRQRGHDHRDGAAADPARGRGRVGGDPARSSSSEGIDVRLNAKCISVRAATADDVAARVDCAEGSAGGRGLAPAAGRRAPSRTPTISGSTRPASRSTSAATSWWTTSCAPTCRASGRSATATARARSRTPSYNDFEIVAANLLDNDPRRVSDRIPAYALYIDPPLGRAGHDRGRGRASAASRALVGKRPMTRVGRAVEKGETAGLHEDRRRRGDQGDPRRGDPRYRRRRGDPLRSST